MPARTPRIQTTVVGSYPVPDWLVAAPSEQALVDATRVVIGTQEPTTVVWIRGVRAGMGLSTSHRRSRFTGW